LRHAKPKSVLSIGLDGLNAAPAAAAIASSSSDVPMIACAASGTGIG
jgi:hypothetical protein